MCQRCELSSGWDPTVMGGPEDQVWKNEPKKGGGFSSSLTSSGLTALGPEVCPVSNPGPSRCLQHAPHLLGGGGSVALARLAAHLSEVRAAAELELQYQRAVGHFVHVFAF